MSNILYFAKRYVKDILIALLSLSIIGLGIYCYYISFEQTDNQELALEEKDKVEEVAKVNNEETKQTINVDVKGAVKNPGVYQVEVGSIVNDVITLAGGFKTNAYQNGINLSKKVVDEMVVYVYTKSEITKNKTTTSQNEVTIEVETQSVCTTSNYNISECVEEKQSLIVVDENKSTTTNNDNKTSIININTASVSELTTLSGIGEAKAKAIITYRETNGNFKTISEIKNVSGIGDAIFEKIKDYITV